MTAISGRAPLYLIDSSIYIFRSYFDYQPLWHSRSGSPTEAVYGFARFLLGLMTRERPQHIVAAFDESLGTGFRHRWYPDYKANRSLPDEELAFQLTACRAFAEVIGIPTCASAEYEADDLIATYARHGREAGCSAVIVSADKDLAQLLGPGDSLWDYGRKPPLDRAEFVNKRGFAPERVPEFLALVGDPSDNIPGLPGVGAKTATVLLKEFASIDELLVNPQRVTDLAIRGGRRIAAQVPDYAQQVQLSRRLATLAVDAPVETNLEGLYWNSFDLPEALALCREYGLDQLAHSVTTLHRSGA